MSKKKLLLVLQAIDMNGAVKGMLDFVRILDKEEWQIDLFLFEPNINQDIQMPEGIRVLPPDPACIVEWRSFPRAMFYTLKNLRLGLMIRRILCKILDARLERCLRWKISEHARQLPGHYDVAIGGAMGSAWSYVINSVTADTKLLWLHTDVDAGIWPAYWNYYKQFVEKASCLVCDSCAIRDMMCRKAPLWARKIKTVNYVIRSKMILAKAHERLPSAYMTNGIFRMVTVGRYCGQKGIELLPKIADGLDRAGLKYEWYLVMPGCVPGRRGNCVYIDGMSNPYPVVASADLYVQPSKFEGYGLTVSEALVLNKYIVATDIPPFREQIVDTTLGLFAKYDSDDFVEKILDAVKRVSSGNRCLDYTTPYTVEKIRAQFNNVLESVQSGRC